MNPILIFEHIESSGPGHFKTFLDERSIPSRIIRPNEGDAIPRFEDVESAPGFCFCGGIESVTEPTAWMIDEIELIRASAARHKPVIGHCLGGQLISKALGGEVFRHTPEEFGWSRLHVEANAASRQWLDEPPPDLVAMQWHTDAFTIPSGATRILTGEHCANQAFVYDNMLAMQFHIEASAETIQQWARKFTADHPPPSPSVQTGDEIMAQLDAHLATSRQLAGRLYETWLRAITSAPALSP